MVAYQAILGNPTNVARVQAARSAIDQVGGRVQIAPPTKDGMTLVVLTLPEGYAPERFLPGLPFYPV
jgi:hypothetical protein